MKVAKIGKTVNGSSKHLWTGEGDGDIYTAEGGIFQLQGGGGDDTLTGNDRSTIFLFESNPEINGVDTLTNFKIYDPATTVQDTLDLSQMFGKDVQIDAGNVGDYIKVVNNQLMVDLDGAGAGAAWQQVASFDNNGTDAGGGYLASGDQLKIRTGTFEGEIAASVSASNEKIWEYSYIYINGDHTYKYSKQVIFADGVEVENIWGSSTNIGYVDFYNNAVEINFTYYFGYADSDFVGIQIKDINNQFPAILDVNILNNTMSGLDDSRVTFDENNLWVNWQGLTANNGTQITLELVF